MKIYKGKSCAGEQGLSSSNFFIQILLDCHQILYSNATDLKLADKVPVLTQLRKLRIEKLLRR